MPSVIRKHYWSMTHRASGTIGASGTLRTSEASGTLGINWPKQSS